MVVAVLSYPELSEKGKRVSFSCSYQVVCSGDTYIGTKMIGRP